MSDGIPAVPERAGSTDVVFHEAGLGFVDSERRGGSGRQAEVSEWKSLFIDSVAALVKHAEERGGEIRLIETGGEADVARAESGAKRVVGGVDSAGVEIEADRFGDLPVEGLLGGGWVGAWRELGRAGGGCFDGAGGDFAEFRADGIEQIGDVGGGDSVFIAFEQGVVGFVRVSPEFGFFAGEGEQGFQMGGESGEVRVFSGIGPRVFGERVGGRFADDQFGGEQGGAVERPAEFAEIGGVYGVIAGV